MSNAMRIFLEAYLVFADSDGEYNPYNFDTCLGLCSNSITFLENSTEDYGLECGHALMDELHQMLAASGLDTDYPFGEAAYDDAVTYSNQHQHTPRIEWIKEQLDDL